MASLKLVELEKDLQELKTFVDQAQRPRIKDILSLQVRKIETDVGALKEQLAPAGAATTKPAAAAAVPAASKSRYEVELSQYAFDQSDKFVKLFVTLAGVEKSPEDNVVVDFTPNSLVLTVKDLNNRDHKLQINNLLEPIDVAKSYRKLKTGMVVIYAKKVTEGSKWSDLTLIEKRLKDIKKAELAVDSDSKDPTSGLMKIMQQMYNSGDTQTKQMISKAWVEGEEKRLKEMPNN